MIKGHKNHNYCNARIQACKCQIELKAAAVVKTIVEDLSEAHDAIDEMKKVRFL